LIARRRHRAPSGCARAHARFARAVPRCARAIAPVAFRLRHHLLSVRRRVHDDV